MPRLPIDYSRSVLYKICSRDKTITDIYVGSTTDFSKRKSRHKTDCNKVNNKNYNLYVYGFIRENGGWVEWEMIQIEEYDCCSKRELEFKEEQLRSELKATLNMKRCWRDKNDKYICKVEGCNNIVQNNEVCKKHGATVKKYICKFENCKNQVVKNGLCHRHRIEVDLETLIESH